MRGRGRFWYPKTPHIITKRGGGVDRGRGVERVEYRCLKGGIFWEGGVDSGRVAYSSGKRGRFWEGEVYSGRVAYKSLKNGYILGGSGIFWEGGVYSGRVAYRSLNVGILWEEGVDSRIRRHLTESQKRGVDRGREGNILGGSNIDV